ncbi:Anaphase-promoting complex (APC) subunit 10 [Perkinsela sp. CCAP 1560/4]|nr:Anaphase-promoting complex (APC) subunit 10 [Perkinsela sp. CCAP 1560/4]|eukprot:KNH03730.1 Anaphase-promoting complex (APC) subunit 10 [Perkinsela sp. CCAP 1560/4]
MSPPCSDQFDLRNSEVFRTEAERRLFDLEMNRIEIGQRGRWMASSSKRGHSVAAVRSLDAVKSDFRTFAKDTTPPPFAWEAYVAQRSPTEYWQSEGKLPHFIKCAFEGVVRITQIAVYLDFPTDQSYTPLHLTVHWGMSPFELFPMDSTSAHQFDVEISEPSGWIFLLSDGPIVNGEGHCSTPLLVARCVTLAVLKNHRGGNDTRIREVRVYTEKESQR